GRAASCLLFVSTRDAVPGRGHTAGAPCVPPIGRERRLPPPQPAGASQELGSDVPSIHVNPTVRELLALPCPSAPWPRRADRDLHCRVRDHGGSCVCARGVAKGAWPGTRGLQARPSSPNRT